MAAAAGPAETTSITSAQPRYPKPSFFLINVHREGSIGQDPWHPRRVEKGKLLISESPYDSSLGALGIPTRDIILELYQTPENFHADLIFPIHMAFYHYRNHSPTQSPRTSAAKQRNGAKVHIIEVICSRSKRSPAIQKQKHILHRVKVHRQKSEAACRHDVFRI